MNPAIDDDFKIAKILIVDDKPDNIITLEKIIEDINCDIIKANSGQEALEKVIEHDLALILLDVQMPEMDGYETAELIHGNYDTRHIPIVFVTAIDKDEKYISKGYKTGAVDYLFKPVDAQMLNSKVAVFIQLYYQRKQLEGMLKIQEEISNNLINTSSKLKNANVELDNLARIDPLTGLSNRRDIIEKMEFEKKRYEHNHKNFSIILGDIDYFKKINDTQGHDCGDSVLVSISELFKNIIREKDIASRWGGEEFLIFLPETDIEAGKRIAERIKDQIESMDIEYENDSLHVTMSFGVSQYDETTSLNDCIKNADAGLYFAKTHGRNQVNIKKMNLAQ